MAIGSWLQRPSRGLWNWMVPKESIPFVRACALFTQISECASSQLSGQVAPANGTCTEYSSALLRCTFWVIVPFFFLRFYLRTQIFSLLCFLFLYRKWMRCKAPIRPVPGTDPLSFMTGGSVPHYHSGRIPPNRTCDSKSLISSSPLVIVLSDLCPDDNC